MKKFYDIAKNYLFPINRSLTGQGVVKTLKIIKKEFPLLKIRRFKSGTKVYDWNIPPEWNLYDAYVIDTTSINPEELLLKVADIIEKKK